MNLKQVLKYYLTQFSVSATFGEDRGTYIHRGVDLNQPGYEDFGKPIYSLTNGYLKRKGFDAGGGGGNFIVVSE